MKDTQCLCMLRTRRPLIQEPTRHQAMIVSWYSSSVACSASCRTARGSTVRAKATATASDRPNDITTLQGGHHHMATFVVYLLLERHSLKNAADRTAAAVMPSQVMLFQMLLVHCGRTRLKRRRATRPSSTSAPRLCPSTGMNANSSPTMQSCMPKLSGQHVSMAHGAAQHMA